MVSRLLVMGVVALAACVGEAAIVVTPDHIVSSTYGVTGALVVIDVPFVNGSVGGPDWPEDTDDGFSISAGIGQSVSASVNGWEPDGTPSTETYSQIGGSTVIHYTFNAATGIDLSEGTVINAVYLTWKLVGNNLNRSGRWYYYNPNPSVAVDVNCTKIQPTPDLVLSWTDLDSNVYDSKFQRIMTGPIIVGSDNSFKVTGQKLGNDFFFDTLLLDVTLPPDETAPRVDMLVPADGATVATPTSLTVTFSEAVTTNAIGSITLTNITAGTADIIPVGSGELVLSGADLIITPSTPALAHGSQYAVLIDTNAIQDLAGNFFAGFTNTVVRDWTFTSTTPQSPTLTTDGGATVGIGTATLRGLMTAGGTATATICWGAEPGDTVDGADTSTWDFVSAPILVSDTVAFSNAVSNLYYGIDYQYAVYATNSYGEAWSSVTNFTTMAPQGLSVTNTFAANVTDTEADLLGSLNATQSVFTVRVYWGTNDHTTSAQWVGDTTASNAVVGAFTNGVGQSLSNHVAFLSAATTYYYTYMATHAATNIWALPGVSFATDDPSTPPTLAPGGFVDDRSGGAVRTNVLVTYTVTFSKPMNAATVTLDDFGNAGSATITVGSLVPSANAAIFTVSVTATSGGTLQLQVNQDAVLEDPFTNPLDTAPAIADDTIITVDVIAPTIVPPTAPADDATDVVTTANLVMTFSENIAVGSGNIVLTNLTDGTATTIDVTDGTQVTVSGTTLTIDPTAALLSGKAYAILIDEGAVTDAPAGNPFAGITSTSDWNVKTKAVELLAYYPFDTDFTDAFGNNDLVISSGTPVITNTAGMWKYGDGAAYFNGSSTLDVTGGYTFSFIATDPWSVSLWARRDTRGNSHPVRKDDGSSYLWLRTNNSNQDYVYFNSNGDRLGSDSGAAGTYVHWVLVADGAGNLTSYKDTVVKYGPAPVNNVNGTAFSINQVGYGDGSHIDDLAIFDGALSASQVAELFDGLNFDAWKPPPPTGILLIVR
jgi:methionine-rich copper-binding protein CopC